MTRLPILVVALLTLTAGPLLAQDAEEATGDSLTVRLPEITIEAARSTETSASAPFAVSILERDATDLALTPGRSLNEVLRPLPGIWVNDRYHFALGERISVRGVGYRSNFGVRGIQVVLDGIPLTLPDGQAFLDVVDPATVRQVELIRSPASVFWGNGSGGVLFLSTEFDEAPTFRARMQGGRYGAWQGLLEGSGTAGAWRLHGYASGNGQDGYRDHSAGTRFRSGLSAARSFGDDTSLRLTAAGDVQDTENPSSLTQEQFRSDPSQARPAFQDVNAGKQSEQAQAGAFLSHDLGGATLSASTYYVYRSLDNPLTFGYITYDRNSGGARIALRRTEGRLEGGIGIDGGVQVDDRLEYAGTVDGAPDGGVTLEQQETILSGSAFSYLRFNATERLSVTGGLRVDRLRFEADDALTSGEFGGDDSGSRTFSALSPSVGLSYDAGPARVFAQYSTAFETPTASELSNRPGGGGGFNQQLDPQRIRGFEVGTRGVWADANVQFDVALFRLTVDDLITSFETESGREVYDNLGTNVHRGLESRLTWRATDFLELMGRYTVSDFVIDDAPESTIEGNRVPGIPKHRGYLQGEVNRNGWWARLSGEAVSSFYTNNANDAEAPSYVLMDLRVGNEGVDIGTSTVKPFVAVDNLLDEQYASSVVINAFGGRYYEPGPGIRYSAGVNVVF